MATIEEQIAFLGAKDFVKFTNTEDFPELPAETRHFLKQYGLFTYEKDTFFTDGKLKRFKEGLIEIGTTNKWIGDKYCIDINTGNVVYYGTKENTISVFNSSVQRFQEARYTEIYYYDKIEDELYGKFYENKNHIKYAKIFREMLDKVEPTGIKNFETWELTILEKELGIV